MAHPGQANDIGEAHIKATLRRLHRRVKRESRHATLQWFMSVWAAAAVRRKRRRRAAGLLLRSLRTLDVRVTRQNATAQRVAEALEASGLLQRVLYPGLASHPDQAVVPRSSVPEGPYVHGADAWLVVKLGVGAVDDQVTVLRRGHDF